MESWEGMGSLRNGVAVLPYSSWRLSSLTRSYLALLLILNVGLERLYKPESHYPGRNLKESFFLCLIWKNSVIMNCCTSSFPGMPPRPLFRPRAGFELLLVALCQPYSAPADFLFTGYISIEYIFLFIPHALHWIEMLTFLIVWRN